MVRRTIKVVDPVYKTVAQGAFSSVGIGEGRVIPALIIDVEDDENIPELMRLHNELPPGDAKTQWSLPKTFFAPKHIYLIVEFLQPMEIGFVIEFHLSSQYSLVDGIIRSKAFCLMTGKSTDKVSQRIKDGIVIEVPNSEFEKKWNKLLIDVLKKEFRTMGAPKKEVQNLIPEHIKSMREVWNFRRAT
ncbi:hypothetical protein [Parapedobacter koreensis]|uniref:Uncharacterized protein n=1 Tax=Parapedobacter koreensis TaxID=332977 RepID=A0A1H7FNN9_9SPHI|nr:hypothetical protein [Parapedobacter koreensis]SEK24985.1 hypothetical protein SAMN05421740_101340 [Parapedobacter koreensis]